MPKTKRVYKKKRRRTIKKYRGAGKDMNNGQQVYLKIGDQFIAFKTPLQIYPISDIYDNLTTNPTELEEHYLDVKLTSSQERAAIFTVQFNTKTSFELRSTFRAMNESEASLMEDDVYHDIPIKCAWMFPGIAPDINHVMDSNPRVANLIIDQFEREGNPDGDETKALQTVIKARNLVFCIHDYKNATREVKNLMNFKKSNKDWELLTNDKTPINYIGVGTAGKGVFNIQNLQAINEPITIIPISILI